MAYIEVEQRKRVYFEHFEGRGTAMLLVHGWGVDSRCWDTTLPALLATGRPIISIDHRACGRSDRDFSDVSVGAIARDVVALVTHLELQSVVLNGWSLGGAVVVDAAARLGARVGGLVLTGGATPRYTQAADFPWGGTHEVVQGTIDAITADRAGTFAGVARAVFAEDPGAAQLSNMAGMFLDASPRAYGTLLDLANVDQRALLPKITAPALLAHGDADQFVPLDVARAAAAALPNATLSVYPGCGHAPFLEARDRYIGELVAFLLAV